MSIQIKEKLDAVQRDSTTLFSFNLGKNFNEAIPVLVIMNDQVVPKLQPMTKTLQKFTKCYWSIVVPMLKRDRSYEHVLKTCLLHTDPRFRYALADSTLDAVFTHLG
ncbi:hypothetical protein TNCT_637561 [Trichonephila clavata]|uniref:Uncharacterized protein n=1 Tax=Trichonephila clavata TaxID=2740835 RepID=A0A8X6FR39_TRICU|nr:hypothetical protein TNCT_637561 [Trichonephila clavata]